ncbi:MAG: phosphate ABC transporter permease PstA [Planctomycetes bacterium]|nr:phosphate ABC transporter permease PstA [Planctomycetota bacterium]
MTRWSDRFPDNLRARRIKARIFRIGCSVLTWLSVALLAVLIYHVTRAGIGWLDWQFLNSFWSRRVTEAGIKAGLLGTLWLVSITAVLAIPIGVAAAVYLEEFGGRSRVNRFLDINISNLAGVPSIVYGLLGLALFVRWCQLGSSLLAGGMTLALLVLPVVIIASREAILAVPKSIRLAAFAIGATRWQTVRYHVLPAAAPGIMTGIILSLSRAIGEAAPIIIVGGATMIFFTPEGPMDEFTALPLQIYNWTTDPKQQFQELAAAGILVLLCVLLLMNASAVYIRNRAQKSRPW